MINEVNGTKRGKLKIFFGYAAGVGKTYAMLDAAHTAIRNGYDVVGGYIEPHNRPETVALMEGLELLPFLDINYKGKAFREFDLDKALERKPQIILVDELAHTNAYGCRHKKRYNDVEELLRNGIDVYTTVNVQHIESLNDVVESITHITVKETIPDRIFDNATQVKLVDIEPEDLIDRLQEGKVYGRGQAQRALNNFFTGENLASLREIALRRTADRVKSLEDEKNIARKKEYFTGEHILICISSSPSNSKVIRNAARMASAFHSEFTALYVETVFQGDMSEKDKKQLLKNMKLAKDLGARISTVYGEDISYQISEYAKTNGVTKIVMGRSNTKRTFVRTMPSFVEKLTAIAPNIDIYIIPDNLPKYSPKRNRFRIRDIQTTDILKLLCILTICTLIGQWFYMFGFSQSNINSIYILGSIGISVLTASRFYGVTGSIIGALAYNYFFCEPRFTLHTYDLDYIVTFAIMIVVSLITSTLTSRIRYQAKMAAMKSHRTEVLLEATKKLQEAKSIKEIIDMTAFQINKLLERDVIFYKSKGGDLEAPILYRSKDSTIKEEEYCTSNEAAVAQWVLKNRRSAGYGTDTLPGAKCLYKPLYSMEEVYGVVGIAISGNELIGTLEKSLLAAMLSESGSAMERYYLNEKQKQIAIKAQRESLRSNLLRAISHDLRTPLTCISGNANVLMGTGDSLNQGEKQRLYEDIYDDSLWLINLVENLLSVTRIDNSDMDLDMTPEFWEEVISESLKHTSRKKDEYEIIMDIEDPMMMSKMDPRLIIQVIINIVDNGIKYTEKGSKIVVSARKYKGQAVIEISDNGNGISQKDKERLFDMFFTVDKNRGDSRRGLGLGLSLCKSIINAHNSDIYVRDNLPCGTVFGFKMPLEEVNIDENAYINSGR
ncbi:MAG: sensor histidine kinase KdpD [Clostridium sp.]